MAHQRGVVSFETEGTFKFNNHRHNSMSLHFLFDLLLILRTDDWGRTSGRKQNNDYKQRWRTDLQNTSCCCCISQWIYLHIFLIVICVFAIYAAYSYYNHYDEYGGDIYYYGTIIKSFGVIAAGYSLFGLWCCIPVAFLSLTIYIIADALFSAYLLYLEYNDYKDAGDNDFWIDNFWQILMVVFWLSCAYTFFNLSRVAQSYRGSCACCC